MIEVVAEPSTFEQWREIARNLLLRRVAPTQVQWLTAGQQSIFGTDVPPPTETAGTLRVPKSFLLLSRIVACHSDTGRWSLLYRLLWRLVEQGEQRLLEDQADADVRQAMLWSQAVRREVHKMQAFIRFRSLGVSGAADGGFGDSDAPTGDREEHFVAWFEPQFETLALVVPFFAQRFGSVRWSICTPQRCAHWDLRQVRFTPGIEKPDLGEDALELLWLDYYKSIFNPGRLNTKAMRSEMPMHYWNNLPEARLLPELVRTAGSRVVEMRGCASALKPAVAELPTTLEALHAKVRACRACTASACGGAGVSAEGSEHATLMIVGEQPGDEEDRIGRPFVGPAGRELDLLLAEVRLDRNTLYLTNAVKHFSYVRSGKRRLHRSPKSLEISICRSWLQQEIHLVRPKLILCLGRTAAQSVLGKAGRLSELRGRLLQGPDNIPVLVSYHPAAILRAAQPNELRELVRRDLMRASDIIQDEARRTLAGRPPRSISTTAAG